MTDIIHGNAARPRDPILPRWWRGVDRWTLASVLILFGVGILLGLASSPPLASRNGFSPFHYVTRQGVYGAVGLGAMVVLSMCSPRTIRRLGVLGFILAFAAVALLPLFGTDFGKGAVRWYSLGITALQPSEFLKPGFVIITAWFLAASSEINGPPGRILSFGLTVLVLGFLVLQPDFGQATLVLASWCVMYFVAGAPIVLLIGVATSAAAAGMFAYQNSEHFARRIDGFLALDVDPTTQIGFAANAIREGRFFGVGVGEGSVKWSLPDAHTDFIIAVAAEEYGLILVLAVIFLYLMIVLRAFTRLMVDRDPFARIAGTGMAALIGMQALINMGVAVRLLPAKGMTLPFISYGGSSMLAAGIAMGFLLALTRRRPQGGLGDVFADGSAGQ